MSRQWKPLSRYLTFPGSRDKTCFLRSISVVFQTWSVWATCQFLSKAFLFKDLSKWSATLTLFQHDNTHTSSVTLHTTSFQICVGRVPRNSPDVDIPPRICCLRFRQQKVWGGNFIVCRQDQPSKKIFSAVWEWCWVSNLVTWGEEKSR